MVYTRNKRSRGSFIQIFNFEKDQSKPGRVLQTARIGDLYMSRLTIDPGVVTGNYYHKKTRIMFYVTTGELIAVFEHVRTKMRQQITMRPGVKVVHVPPFVSFATKNTSKRDKAVTVFFSNKPLRYSADNFVYPVITE